MPFKEKKEGTTHSYNDGCGEPAHNDMKITSPTQVCPECKKTHCKHYESDFDRYCKENPHCDECSAKPTEKCACGLVWEHTGKHAPLPEIKTTIRNVGMMRQWLNEDRITDPSKMITNEDILHWLGWDFN